MKPIISILSQSLVILTFLASLVISIEDISLLNSASIKQTPITTTTTTNTIQAPVQRLLLLTPNSELNNSKRNQEKQQNSANNNPKININHDDNDDKEKTSWLDSILIQVQSLNINNNNERLLARQHGATKKITTIKSRNEQNRIFNSMNNSNQGKPLIAKDYDNQQADLSNQQQEKIASDDRDKQDSTNPFLEEPLGPLMPTDSSLDQLDQLDLVATTIAVDTTKEQQSLAGKSIKPSETGKKTNQQQNTYYTVSLTPSTTQVSSLGTDSLTANGHSIATKESDSDEQRLVDSNNVSAILSIQEVNKQNINNNNNNNEDNNNINHIIHRQQSTTILPTTFRNNQQPQNNATRLPASNSINEKEGEEEEQEQIIRVNSEQKAPISCEQAYTQCALRKACYPALWSYNDNCRDLINNKTNVCSKKCLEAMVALRSSELGDDLLNCDCQDNEYCLKSKQNSKTCLPLVEEALKEKTIVSCSTASWICLADQSCSTALEYYYRFCQTLFSQGHCSMRCNNSLTILYRQPKASKLINCHCDGTEEFPCLKYKTYTERLCLNKLTNQFTLDSNQRATHSPSSIDLALSTEDEMLNITNDPETFVSSPTGGLCGGGEDEEYEDSKVNRGGGGEVAGEDEPFSTTLNGIQAAIDNYIPLISGRYFTNLHQKKTQQRNASKKNKQPNGYYDSRRKIGRLPTFESYSSSSSTSSSKFLNYSLQNILWLNMVVGYLVVFTFIVL